MFERIVPFCNLDILKKNILRTPRARLINVSHMIWLPVKDDVMTVLTELCLFSDSVCSHGKHSCEPWTQLWTQYLKRHVHAEGWMQDKDALNNFWATFVFVSVNYAHVGTTHFVGNNLVNKIPKKTLSATLMILCLLFGCKLKTCSIFNKLWLWFIVPFRWGHMARAWWLSLIMRCSCVLVCSLMAD